MEDDHVDRPGVEAQQCVQLTGTNSSIGLIALIYQCPFIHGWTASLQPPQVMRRAFATRKPHLQNRCEIKTFAPFLRALPAWWLLQGGQTRSHPELGRQTPSRQWYYVSRPGRVGRCQACQARKKVSSHHTTDAGRPTTCVACLLSQTPCPRPQRAHMARGGAAR